MTSGQIIICVYACGYGVAIVIASLWPSCVRLIGITTSYQLREPTQDLLIVLAAVIPLVVVEFFGWMFFRSDGIDARSKKSISLAPWLIIATNSMLLFLMLVLVSNYGWSNIISRPFYIESHYRYSTIGVLRWMLVVTPLVAGYLTAKSTSTLLKGVSILPFVLFAVLQFSFGSRQLPLGILLFAAAYYRTRGVLPRLHTGLLLVFLILFSYNSALQNRGLSQHGLIPYSLNLGHGFSEFSDVASTLTDTVSVLDATIVDYQPSQRDYLVSINPLPGKLVGWADVAPRLRLHRYAPYCTLGELGASGLKTVFAHFLVIAITLFFAEKILGRVLGRNDSLSHLCLRIFCLGFAIFSLQYNLRSSTRMLYYGLFLAAVLAVFGLAFSRTRFHITFGERRLL